LTSEQLSFTASRLTDWLAASRDERTRAVHSCLERIRALDPSIHAWVQVAPQDPAGDGPLAGIPFGAKDIIETRGLATQYGSPIYEGRIGVSDAAIIGELRTRGAILMGKTHTTAFAYRTPAPTRNPHNLQHTPGGSSSGSAAAVAAGMVPLALGTQTQGSVLRPASFCGIAGFKPTYGLVSMDGVLPFARSLDTLGFFTATAADMLALWGALGYEITSPGGSERTRPTTSPGGSERTRLTFVGSHDTAGVGRVLSDPPIFGIPQPSPDVEAPIASAFHDAVSRLRAAGMTIQPVDLGDMLTRLNQASRIVMAYEAARFHEQRYKEYGSRLADMANLVQEGLHVEGERYEEAREYIRACQARVTQLYEATPVMLVPAATGPAPFSLASTGDPRMNAPWTALGTPALSIPMAEFNGLPLGLQLTADRGDDARVLHTAARVASVLEG
jgi:Asp-tRNA(Asn)/Glu-tRNA(Gln) amidotransferase A subunit family amidase